MEPIFQLVGSLVASRPAAEAIDAFVQAARRERVAVMAKSPQGATLVRFNATDLRLVALACRTLRTTPTLPLRFAFAIANKDASREAPGADAMDIGTRSLEQAQSLAAAADDGQVLVTPGLCGPLVEAGFTLVSRQLRRPGSEPQAAFAIDLEARPAADGPSAAGAPSAAAAAGVAEDPVLGEIAKDPVAVALQAMATRLDEMARRQVELEWRQQQLLGRLGRVDATRVPGRSWERLVDELDLQMGRIEARLKVIDGSERRLEALNGSLQALERMLAGQLPRLDEVEQLRQRCEALGQRCQTDLQDLNGQRDALDALRQQVDDLLGRAADADRRIDEVEQRRQGVEEVQARATAVTHVLGDIELQLERLSEQRAVIEQVGDRLARLDFTMQEAQSQLHALQRERDLAERIEQSLKAMRARGAARQG